MTNPARKKLRRRALKTAFAVRRPAEVKHVPWVEWYLGGLSGTVLIWLGKKALDRGDVHEYNHCVAVLAIGNTDGDHKDCPLNVDMPLSFNRMHLQVRTDRSE